ncbi:EcsC family protein [Dermacoccaceae bacterium W4C1]
MLGFGKDKKKAASAEPVLQAAEHNDAHGMDKAANTLAERLLRYGFEGKYAFDSARDIADAALKKSGGDREKAVEEIVALHRKLVATSGFVTGLGGLITMPVSLPANVIGFYLLATRMCAAIAHVRGYDIDRPVLRSAVLLTLVGTEADAVLNKAGVVSTGKLAHLATRQLPPAALMVVNKAVGFRLIGQVGPKFFTKLGRAIPLAGGVIGAGLDVLLVNKIASHARSEFPVAASVGGNEPAA